jgi:hypothetical protein
MLLYGGWVGGTMLNDLWSWNGATGEWTSAPSPANAPPRSFTSIVREPVRGVYLMFGGYGAVPSGDQTWQWDPASGDWTQLFPAHVPARRADHSMVFDEAAGRIVLFGGGNAISPYELNDTWTWDPGQQDWVMLSPSAAPPARVGAGMAFDAVSGRVLLFGGSEDRYFNEADPTLSDLWSFDGSTPQGSWELLTPNGPRLSEDASMAFDARRGVMVVYGRSAFSTGRWTWEVDANGWYPTNGYEPHVAGAQIAFDGTRIILFGSDLLAPGSPPTTWGWDGDGWRVLAFTVHRTAANTELRTTHSGGGSSCMVVNRSTGIFGNGTACDGSSGLNPRRALRRDDSTGWRLTRRPADPSCMAGSAAPACTRATPGLGTAQPGRA